MVNEASVLAALAQFPNGATAKQIAASLDCRPVYASAKLGELYFAHKLDRTLVEPSRKVSTEYRYSIRPAEHLSPPSQWRPEARFAERETAA